MNTYLVQVDEPDCYNPRYAQLWVHYSEQAIRDWIASDEEGVRSVASVSRIGTYEGKNLGPHVILSNRCNQ